MRSQILTVAAVLFVAVPAASGRANAETVLRSAVPAPAAPNRQPRRHAVGLGKVLTSQFGGQIFDFDVDRNGADGILAEAPSFGSAIETFDIVKGKITKVVRKQQSPSGNDELVSYGIFTGDIGFIDDERVIFKNGLVDRHDRYFTMDPVTGGKVTGHWTSPQPANTILESIAQNQVTATQAILAYHDLHSRSQLPVPSIYAANFATNTTTDFRLDPNLFGLADGPALAQDTTTNQAVIALSPDGGRVGGAAPLNVLIDLTTGKQTQFTGLNNGPFGSGFVNGLAVDSTTGIACTTTELNAQVEFYTLSNGTGVGVQLPNTGPSSQLNSGTTIANDPVNGLFLVAQPISSTGGGSSIDVFGETGNLVETINGFSFTQGNIEIGGYPGLAIDPKTRIGWVSGPGVNQIQQFFY